MEPASDVLTYVSVRLSDAGFPGFSAGLLLQDQVENHLEHERAGRTGDSGDEDPPRVLSSWEAGTGAVDHGAFLLSGDDHRAAEPKCQAREHNRRNYEGRQHEQNPDDDQGWILGIGDPPGVSKSPVGVRFIPESAVCGITWKQHCFFLLSEMAL